MFLVAGWAKQSNIRKGNVFSYWPPNVNRMWLKLTEISTFENGGFLFVCEKCNVGDVTVGGVSVVSTSGFRFPVGYNLYRSTCSGDCLWSVYFRSEGCSEVGKTFGTCHFKRVPLGLAGAVTFSSIAKNNKRWGKTRWIAQLFPKQVIYCKFNNFGTACRIRSIFEGKVGEVNPHVPRGSTTPTSGPNIKKILKPKMSILPITFDSLVWLTPK